jgi:hypothetical protein
MGKKSMPTARKSRARSSVKEIASSLGALAGSTIVERVVAEIVDQLVRCAPDVWAWLVTVLG